MVLVVVVVLVLVAVLVVVVVLLVVVVVRLVVVAEEVLFEVVEGVLLLVVDDVLELKKAEEAFPMMAEETSKLEGQRNRCQVECLRSVALGRVASIPSLPFPPVFPPEAQSI